MCSYTAPLHDGNGKFIGVICASIETQWLTSKIDNIRLYDHSHNFIIGKAAGYIVHPDNSLIINETIFSYAIQTGNTALAEAGKRMISGETGMSELSVNGRPGIIFFTSVPSNNWSIATICPESDIFAGAYRIVLIMLIIALLSIIIMALIVSLTVRKATAPLTTLAASADRIAEGDFNSAMPRFWGNDEIGRLCRSFSSMQQSLSSYMDRLQRTTAAKQRIESELSIAREIQMGMVPKTFPPYPERDDIDIYAVLYPAVLRHRRRLRQGRTRIPADGRDQKPFPLRSLHPEGPFQDHRVHEPRHSRYQRGEHVRDHILRHTRP